VPQERKYYFSFLFFSLPSYSLSIFNKKESIKARIRLRIRNEEREERDIVASPPRPSFFFLCSQRVWVDRNYEAQKSRNRVLSDGEAVGEGDQVPTCALEGVAKGSLRVERQGWQRESHQDQRYLLGTPMGFRRRRFSRHLSRGKGSFLYSSSHPNYYMLRVLCCGRHTTTQTASHSLYQDTIED